MNFQTTPHSSGWWPVAGLWSYSMSEGKSHIDVIKWKQFPRYWPYMRGIQRSPVNSTHKGQWRGALMFSLICVWINGWVNNCEAGDLRRYLAHYDVTVINPRSFWEHISTLGSQAKKNIPMQAHTLEKEETVFSHLDDVMNVWKESFHGLYHRRQPE